MSQRGLALVLIPVISIFILLAIYPLQPPAVVPASSPPTEFSAERAMAHLQHIARAPHPTGSAENVRVRAYIVEQMTALGLATEVQSTAVLRVPPRFASGATVSNVIGRSQGSRNTRAVMLVAHYDSVPSGPGASDDGSGVVTLLETMRALKAGPPLQNDVILLATDGEELGLLGAQAFMTEHAWAKDVGVVLNFEARGTCGASMLFETSSGNAWLLRQLAAAAPRPAGSSYMYEFYKRMPNDTDFSVFRRGGLAGLNFAYGGNWTHYHTAKDNLPNLDLRSLQHDGSYALALTRRFGNSDLTKPNDGDAVYFTLFGSTVVYAQKWAVPLMIAVALLFIGVVILGMKKSRLTLRGVAMGFFSWLVSLVGAGLVSTFGWGALEDSSFVNPLPHGIAYNSSLYASAFLALTIAIAAAVYALVHGRAGHENLTAGALLWWLVALIVASLLFPGASYLFGWPLAASLFVFCYCMPIIRFPAAVAMLEEPRIAVLEASTENNVKNLRLVIAPPRQARALWFEVRGAMVLAATVSGKTVSGLPHESGMQMYYVGIPDGGLVVTLSVPARAHPELQVIAQCDGLPAVLGASYRPRPETLMPSPRPPFDSCTLIAKTFRSLEGAGSGPEDLFPSPRTHSGRYPNAAGERSKVAGAAWGIGPDPRANADRTAIRR